MGSFARRMYSISFTQLFQEVSLKNSMNFSKVIAFAMKVSLFLLAGCVTARQAKLDLGSKPLNKEQ